MSLFTLDAEEEKKAGPLLKKFFNKVKESGVKFQLTPAVLSDKDKYDPWHFPNEIPIIRPTQPILRQLLWERDAYVLTGHTIIDRYTTTTTKIEEAKKNNQLYKYESIGWVLPNPHWNDSYVLAAGFKYIDMCGMVPNYWLKIINFEEPAIEMIIKEE